MKLPLRTYVKARLIVRDLYEALLIITTGILLYTNDLYCLDIIHGKVSRHRAAYYWSTACFDAGLLIILMQGRPKWFRRCGHWTRCAWLPLQMIAIFCAMEITTMQVWLPIVDIVNYLVDSFVQNQTTLNLNCSHRNLYYFLVTRASNFICFTISLGFFILSLDSVVHKWCKAFKYAVVGIWLSSARPKQLKYRPLVKPTVCTRFPIQLCANPRRNCYPNASDNE